MRSPNLVYAYLALGVFLAVVTFGDAIYWDWLRGVLVSLAVVNAGISLQITLVYTNIVYPNVPEHLRFFGNSPSSYWIGSAGMTLLCIGIAAGLIGRAGEEPGTPLTLPIMAVAMLVLSAWGVMVLRALHRLGEGLNE